MDNIRNWLTDVEKEILVKLSNKERLNVAHIRDSIFGNITFPDAITNARQMLWHLEKANMDIPKCPVCNNDLQWHPDNREYRKFCSKKCTGNGTAEIAKRTSIDKNNGVHHTQTKEFLEKIKKTTLERYGVEHYSQTEEFKQATNEANIKKLGVSHPAQSPVVIEKMKKTSLERYGVEHYTHTQECKDKMRKTMLEKYGVENYTHTLEYKNKTKQTNLEKYGVYHEKQQHITPDALNILCDKLLFSAFIKDKSVVDIATDLNVNVSTIYNHIRKHDVKDVYNSKGPSILETEMSRFLDSLSLEYETNNRTILNRKELDFYIPKYNLAIEMNGIYWHSDFKKTDKNYHYNKWRICNDNGIHLISIFEDDWNLQNDKIKNILMAHVGMKPRGNAARNTYISKIAAKIVKPFLEQYHLQGFVGGTHFGAFDKEKNLVAVMTFGYTRNHKFELKRFAMDNYNHPGLFSKLFKHAQQELRFNEVVSFSDNSCFTGNVYEKNGFEFIQVIKPDYRYLVSNTRSHKSNYTKENIKKKFPHMTEAIANGMSESAAMEYLGIPKIWDCGKKEWLWKNPLLLR